MEKYGGYKQITTCKDGCGYSDGMSNASSPLVILAEMHSGICPRCGANKVHRVGRYVWRTVKTGWLSKSDVVDRIEWKR